MVFINTFCRVIVQFEKVGFGPTMRINNMNDAHNPYELEADAMGENIQVENAETKYNGRRYQETPPDIETTMKRLRVELESYR